MKKIKRKKVCMMGNATFIGGVHPYDGKELSKDKPTITLTPTSEMVFPMAQHIGAPAKPVVAVGDTVLVGQCSGDDEIYGKSQCCPRPGAGRPGGAAGQGRGTRRL